MSAPQHRAIAEREWVFEVSSRMHEHRPAETQEIELDDKVIIEHPAQGAQLVNYDAMCVAIEAAYEIDEVKDIRDKAVALELYMRQIGNTEAEDRCYKIRMRAQRKAGELSKKIEKATGNQYALPDGPTKEKVLADAGISRQSASEWERLADVPEEHFEAALANNKRPSIGNIVSKPSDVTPVSGDALLFIGTMRDFERRGYLAKTPADFMETMTPDMLEEVYRIAPLASKWISTIQRESGGPSTKSRVKIETVRFGNRRNNGRPCELNNGREARSKYCCSKAPCRD